MKEFMKRQGLHLAISVGIAFGLLCVARVICSNNIISLALVVFVAERAMTSQRIKNLATSFVGKAILEFKQAGESKPAATTKKSKATNKTSPAPASCEAVEPKNAMAAVINEFSNIGEDVDLECEVAQFADEDFSPPIP